VDGVYFQIDKMQCLRIGEGSSVLFAFHGFGQNPHCFEMLRELFPEYSIYSFDILSFGKTPQKADIQELIQRFCENYKIRTFSVLAFSIGAKMALSMLETFSERVEKVCLVAPDGFKKTFWYELAVSWLGKPFFWQFIRKPHRIFKFAYYLQALGILKSEQIRMAQKYTESTPKRFLLWRTWLAHQYLYPNHHTLHKIFSVENPETLIFASDKDELIKHKPIARFAKRHKSVQLVYKSCSHYRVLSEALKSQEFLDFFRT